MVNLKQLLHLIDGVQNPENIQILISHTENRSVALPLSNIGEGTVVYEDKDGVRKTTNAIILYFSEKDAL